MAKEKLDILGSLAAVKPGKCDVRLSDEEMKMLTHLADIEEVTKSDIIRKALRLLYKQYKK